MDAHAVTLLLNGKAEDEELIKLLIDITTQAILNYCNLYVFPPELEGTLVSIVAELYNDTMNMPAVGALPVSTVSEGGRSVSFDSSKVQYGLMIDDKLAHRSILNKFKRLYKVPPCEDTTSEA